MSSVISRIREDLAAVMLRDPAARNQLEILITYPGVHALWAHRIEHWLWKRKLKFIARVLASRTRNSTGIEIHPGAVIGRRVVIDHGMGVVIGETAIIGDNVTLFQGVTLGGTGKETGKRHPTLGNNIVVGSGAKVLGNIKIGDHSYIGANAVVLREVPAHSTVVGVPGRVVKHKGKKVALEMSFDHTGMPDPLLQKVARLQKELETLRKSKGKS